MRRKFLFSLVAAGIVNSAPAVVFFTTLSFSTGRHGSKIHRLFAKPFTASAQRQYTCLA